MTRPTLAAAQLPLLTVQQVLRPSNPLQQLCDHQRRFCAACGESMVKQFARRDLVSGRVLALVCKACSITKRPYEVPSVSDLLALRLTPCSVRTGLLPVTPAMSAALTARDWSVLGNPAQVLWTEQAGRCAGTGHLAMPGRASLVIDADEDTDLMLGIFCLQCKALEGKGGRRAQTAWRAYRRNPPGLALAATRGITRKILRGAS